MYRPLGCPVREEDFDGHITENYFGAGWTKVYNEKMCEFYARTGPARYSVLRHSNIYGPHDKFDLEKSHVFGATMTKMMTAREDDRLVVWGDGSDERDFLYVEDLMEAVAALIERQKTPFELLNVGAGRSYSIKSLVAEMLAVSGRKLEVEYDVSKPSIGFKLAVNVEKIQKLYGWKARTSLKEGIQKTLAWYRQHVLPRQPSVS
jgi:nucleoside-diphosphate-sugar epimerase